VEVTAPNTVAEEIGEREHGIPLDEPTILSEMEMQKNLKVTIPRLHDLLARSYARKAEYESKEEWVWAMGMHRKAKYATQDDRSLKKPKAKKPKVSAAKQKKADAFVASEETPSEDYEESEAT